MTSFLSNLGFRSNIFSDTQSTQSSQLLEASTRRASPLNTTTVPYISNVSSATVTQGTRPSLSTSQAPVKIPYRDVPHIQPRQPTSMAVVGVDTNHDGKANYYYAGADRNHDGIPDALQQRSAPMAVVGVDTNHDGKANYYYTGVDRNHDGIPDALQGIGSTSIAHTVPHAVPHVHVRGSPIPLYEVHHLRAMPMEILRVHANHVYKTLGPTTLNTPVPVSDHRLVEWLIDVHDGHLHPLRAQAVPHSVPHVYYQGTPLPMYEVHHLKSMEPAQLRAHANHVVKTLPKASKPVPDHDHLLLDYLVEMHEKHIKEHMKHLKEIESGSPTGSNYQHHPISSHTSPQSASTKDHRAQHSVVPHAVRHILVQGVPIPYYELHHLRAMSVDSVRAHAHHIYQTIGGLMPVPASDHRLVEWVVEIHNTHLHPLRDQAVQHQVPHVYYFGTPIPLYESHHLRSMSMDHLRIHANHLYRTVALISKPIPDRDELLLEWLLEMHELHLHEHTSRIRQLESPGGSMGCGNSQCAFLDAVRREPIEPWMIAAEASKLRDLQPLSDSDLQHIIMDTLVSHGLKATASTLRRECALDRSEFPLVLDEKQTPIVPPDYPPGAADQFKNAREANSRQQEFIEECTEQVTQQRGRLQKLTERLHVMRMSCNGMTEEELQAEARLREQDARIEELKLSSAAFERIEGEVKAAIQLHSEEKSTLAETLATRDANIQTLMTQIKAAEMRLEDLRKKSENSESAQAQRIRQLLLNWDTPNGPKRIAAETFSHVDVDRDGKLEWATDEVCRFVRLLFHYHNVTAPPWADGVWYELFRLCDLEKSHYLDITEALRFARGCFEAALRMLSGV